MIYEIELIS